MTSTIQIPEYVSRHAEAYHIDLFQKFLLRADIRGKMVLEVGSDYHLATARLFVANGAKMVLANNLGDWKSPEPLPDALTFQIGDICTLNLPENSFDIIYGIAILEHIVEIGMFAEAINRLLKDDGVAYFQGWPLWTGPTGHHVWIEGLRKDNEAPEVLYSFADRQKNPIPDWMHLTVDGEGMKKILTGKGVKPQDAKRIAEYIYNTKKDFTGCCSNFKSASEIICAFHDKFIVEATRGVEPTTNEYFEIAQNRYSKFDLETVGLQLILRKVKPF